MPDSAVVQWEGLAWAYVAPRRPVVSSGCASPPIARSTGGWIVEGGAAVRETPSSSPARRSCSRRSSAPESPSATSRASEPPALDADRRSFATPIRHPGSSIGLARRARRVRRRRRLQSRALDVFPEFAPPQVSIQTEAPGLSPEQVEILVTKPIEDAINGVEGIAAVRSQSIQGLS